MGFFHFSAPDWLASSYSSNNRSAHDALASPHRLPPGRAKHGGRGDVLLKGDGFQPAAEIVQKADAKTAHIESINGKPYEDGLQHVEGSLKTIAER